VAYHKRALDFSVKIIIREKGANEKRTYFHAQVISTRNMSTSQRTKKHDDLGGDCERGGGSGERVVARRVTDWQRKMLAAGIDDRGPRIDFCFDLIIVTPGKRPAPVILLPPFACPTTGTSHVPREMYVQLQLGRVSYEQSWTITVLYLRRDQPMRHE